MADDSSTSSLLFKYIIAGIVILGVLGILFWWLSTLCKNSKSAFCQVTNAVGDAFGALGKFVAFLGNNIWLVILAVVIYPVVDIGRWTVDRIREWTGGDDDHHHDDGGGGK